MLASLVALNLLIAALQAGRRSSERVLQASELLHRAIIAAEPECVKLLAEDGTILQINPAGMRMLEADHAAQVIGQPLTEIIAPQHRQAFVDLINDVFKGEPSILDFEVIGLKGTHRWLESHAVPMRDDNGQVNALLSITRDISQRKKIEQDLSDSRQKMLLMMENAVDAVFVADPTTESWVYVNAPFVELLGYSRAELMAANIFDVVTLGFRDLYKSRFATIALFGGVSTLEIQVNRKDGSTVFLEMNTVTLADSTVYGSCRDITERKHSKEEMRIAAVTFETQEAIMITDAHANILRVNKAFQEITGYKATEVTGKNPRIFQSGRHDATFYRDMWLELSNADKRVGEIWDKRKDGEVYPKLMTITAVRNNKHQIINYVAVFRDISNRKKSENEIYQLAFYDALTLLPNRRLLIDRLQHAVLASVRNNRYGAVLFLDLDNFKTINDTEGHSIGDQLLIEVGRRLQASVRDGDSVARLGGDEFVVVLEGLSNVRKEATSQTQQVVEKNCCGIGSALCPE